MKLFILTKLGRQLGQQRRKTEDKSSHSISDSFYEADNQKTISSSNKIKIFSYGLSFWIEGLIQITYG